MSSDKRTNAFPASDNNFVPEYSPSIHQRALAAIVESSDDAILSKTLDGIIMSWNKGAERIYGYTAAEIVGKHISILFPPEHTDELTGIMQRLRMGERIDHFETVRYKKNGSRVHVSVSISPIIDDQGHVVAASAIARDITEQQRLRRIKGLLASIVGSADDAILSKDMDGVILSWNTGAEKLYGYTSDEIVGRNVDILIPQGSPNEISDILARLRRGERIANYETLRAKKDGTMVHISLSVSPVYDDNGNVIAASAIARDITQRKRDEEEKARLFDQLNRSLSQQKLLLQEVFHRVKNNLQVISSLLELQSRHITKDPKKIFSAFTESIERIKAMALVHEKLYGTDHPDRLEFSAYLRALVPHVIRSSKTGKNIEANITGDSCLLDLHLAIPMGLIFNELITNSVKHAFAERAHGKIRIHCKTDGDVLKVKISDDGIGLPPDFDFDETRSFGFKIVRLLTRQVNGTITSLQENGTTFEVAIPTTEKSGVNHDAQ